MLRDEFAVIVVAVAVDVDVAVEIERAAAACFAIASMSFDERATLGNANVAVDAGATAEFKCKSANNGCGVDAGG